MKVEQCDDSAKVLKAMGHPVRLKLLKKIYQTENCDQICLIQAFNMPQSTVAMHLCKLHQQDLIRCEHINNHVYYSITDERVVRLIVLLQGSIED